MKYLFSIVFWWILIESFFFHKIVFCLNCSYKGINVSKVCYWNLPLNQRPLVYFSKLNASLLHYVGIIKYSFSDFLVCISNQCPPQCRVATSSYWWGENVGKLYNHCFHVSVAVRPWSCAGPLFCPKKHLFVLLAPGTTVDFLAALNLPCVSCGWCRVLKVMGFLSYSLTFFQSATSWEASWFDRAPLQSLKFTRKSANAVTLS